MAPAKPSPPSPLTPAVMEPIESLTRAMWPGVPVVPVMSTGATDAGVVTLAGDFDADGIRDVVSALDDDEIEIRRVVRQAGRLQLGEVIAEVDGPGRGQALAPDLNADGRSDLVIYAPRRAEGVVTLFLSSSERRTR